MNNNEYDISYQNDMIHSYMVIKVQPKDKLLEYQINMMANNSNPFLLNMHRKQLDGENLLLYKITSMITLEQYLSRKQLKRCEFLSILKSLIKGIESAKRYLLHNGSFLLDYRFIYINPSALEVALAYIPIETKRDLKEYTRAFIMDLVVYKSAFASSEDGNYIYRLLNLLKDEAFSIEQLSMLINDMAMVKDDVVNRDEVAQKPIIKTKASNQEIVKRQEQIEEKSLAIGEAPAMKKTLILLMTQIIFLALGALVVRGLVIYNGDPDGSALAGVILVIGAVDFLVLKKLKFIDKKNGDSKMVSVKTASNSHKINKAKRFLKENKKKDMSPIVPMFDYSPGLDMETKFLQEERCEYGFLQSCNGDGKEKILLDKPSFVIGRLKNQVDYIAANNAIGKMHAEIIRQNGQYYLKDLNSKNGTFINGERVASNVVHFIKDKDTISFANSSYRFFAK